MEPQLWGCDFRIGKVLDQLRQVLNKHQVAWFSLNILSCSPGQAHGGL